MAHPGIFIAATGQHVGKTTISLGILSGLKKIFKSVGFVKPVGQEHVEVEEGLRVDKDVVLFKKVFNLSDRWSEMSPVIIPTGFTKEFLDGEVMNGQLKDLIVESYRSVSNRHPFTLVEGTGHIGVGSIVGVSNAKVAADLNLDVIIIASGGLGSAMDELTLNITMCRAYGARVRGIILNRVLDEKREMILNYFPKALAEWNIPLIGCIPYLPFLSTPTMKDFETLFNTSLLSGERHRMRHFHHKRLVACSQQANQESISKNELIITPVSREDIILQILEKAGGMILTGRQPPSKVLIERLQPFDVPVLFAPLYSYDAMELIASQITKIQMEDVPKVAKAIHLVEQNINFDELLNG